MPRAGDVARWFATLLLASAAVSGQQDASRAQDRTLQRDALGQGNDQFLRELALRESDQNNAWDYRWAGFGL